MAEESKREEEQKQARARQIWQKLMAGLCEAQSPKLGVDFYVYDWEMIRERQRNLR